MSPVLAALLTLLILGAEAVSILRDGGTCYNVTSIESLDRSKVFEGSWIEVLRAPNDVEEDQICGVTDYKLKGNKVTLRHTMETGETTTKMLKFKEDNSIVVNYNGSPLSSYVVVDTDDHNTYAVVYSCQQEPAFQERAWILGRTADTVPVDEIIARLETNHNQLFSLLKDGLTCPKQQTTTEGGPTCLELHNTEDLDVTKVFTKSWIEVMRSANDVEEDGVCGSTVYIMKGDDQGTLKHKMDTGKSIFAKLNFLEDNSIEATYTGSPSLYVVVDTDNDNYAVVYSCQQQPGGALKERAWLLGKTVGLEGIPPQVLFDLENDQPQLYELLKDGLFCPKPETTTTSTTSPPTEPPPPSTTTEAPVTPCLDISHDQGLNVSMIFGVSWVEVLRSANDIEGEACGVTEYFETSESSKKYVTHNLDTGNYVTGMLKFLDDGCTQVNYGNASSSYVVSLTDNQNFAVIYSCQQIAPYLERAWILGSSPDTIPEGLMSTLSANQPHVYDLLKDGLSCPKQETTTDNGVRTTCLDIHNKENLDLTQMVGTWVEVTRTPNSFEKDLCGSVKYNSHDSVLWVQHLFGGSTVTGQGMVNTTTELQISMFIAGQTSRYYVVDTDYKTFAIVYSCTQLDNNMQEQAWVLSRSGTVDVNFVDTVLQPYGDLDLLLDNGIECKDVVVTTTPDTTTTTEFEPEPITVPGYPYNFYFFYQFRGFNTTQ